LEEIVFEKSHLFARVSLVARRMLADVKRLSIPKATPALGEVGVLCGSIE
jgi:hypothetical protein